MWMLDVKRAVETTGILFAFQVGSQMSLGAFFQEMVWHDITVRGPGSYAAL